MIVDLGHLIRGKLIVLANPDEDPALLCLSGSRLKFRSKTFISVSDPDPQHCAKCRTIGP